MKILIAGAGGFAKELAQIVEDCNYECVGFLAPPETEAPEALMGYPVLRGGLVPESWNVLLGMGHSWSRSRAAANFPKEQILGISHPTSTVGRTSNPHRIRLNSDGIILCIGVTITENAHIGYGAMLNMHSIVSHDASVGAWSILSPGAMLMGGASVGEGCEIGTGAKILPGIKVGNWATIGAGAIVTEDVPDNATAVGIPARVINIKQEEWHKLIFAAS